MTLEERITRLEDIEAIRYLQSKYQRCLDTRDFNGIAECFADDVVSHYDNNNLAYNGKDAVIKYLCSVMSLKMPSAHHIHGGEIDVSDATHASAKWYLEDYLVVEQAGLKIHGAAIYENQYEKIDGVWKIKVIGYRRTFEYMEGRSLLNRMTLKKKTYFDEIKKANPDELTGYNQYFYQNYVEKKKKK